MAAAVAQDGDLPEVLVVLRVPGRMGTRPKGGGKGGGRRIGAYTDASASQPPAPKLKVTCSMTAYLGWALPRYEGIWVS